MSTCSVPTCDREATTRGWCTAHYQRWHSTGDVQADRPIGDPTIPRPCSVDGCDGRHYSQGLCELHYRRQRRTGEVDRPERPAECAVDGCDREVTERGLCHGHYLRLVRIGDVQAHVPLGRRRQPAECTVDGCGRTSKKLGLCPTHYNRFNSYGDVLADVPIRRATGEGSISHGYRNVPVPKELRHLTNGASQFPEHRLVMARHLGRPLTCDEVVHHRNGDRTDNRLENLELWSVMQPKGQRVNDKIAYALELLNRYAPELLGQDTGL